jgi:hypothetical protein
MPRLSFQSSETQSETKPIVNWEQQSNANTPVSSKIAPIVTSNTSKSNTQQTQNLSLSSIGNTKRRGIRWSNGISRRKKIAAATLTLSLVFGVRWWQGGQLPNLPPDTFHPIYHVDGPSANEKYIQALTKLTDAQILKGEYAYYQIADVFPRKLSEVDLAHLVQTHQTALDYLHQAASLPYYADYYPAYTGTYYKVTPQYPIHAGLEKPVPNFVKTRGIAHLAVVEAYVQAKSGEYGKAVSTGMDIVKFGNDL